MQNGKLDKLCERLAGNKRPVVVFLEITTRCNLHCWFCYLGEKCRGQRDIPRQRLFRIIDSLAKMGCIEVILLGGEPFIRKDFLKIYNYIAKRGIFVRIFSNGTLLRRDILSKINRYPFYSLRISLYGASAKTYEDISGAANAFKRVMQGIRLAREEKINFELYTLLNRINRRDVNRIKNIAKKFAVEFHYPTRILAKSDGDTSHYQLCNYRHAKKYICTKGCIFIDNLGRLVFCPVVRGVNYDLNRITLQKAWMNRLKRKIRIECPRM